MRKGSERTGETVNSEEEREEDERFCEEGTSELMKKMTIRGMARKVGNYKLRGYGWLSCTYGRKGNDNA